MDSCAELLSCSHPSHRLTRVTRTLFLTLIKHQKGCAFQKVSYSSGKWINKHADLLQQILWTYWDVHLAQDIGKTTKQDEIIFWSWICLGELKGERERRKFCFLEVYLHTKNEISWAMQRFALRRLQGDCSELQKTSDKCVDFKSNDKLFTPVREISLVKK